MADRDAPWGGWLKAGCVLLALPLLPFAALSTLILDAPWAAQGWGAALAWLAILGCLAMPLSLLAAVGAMDRWDWPPGRAARIPLAALPGFAVALLVLATA